jgi:hypothetical protein
LLLSLGFSFRGLAYLIGTVLLELGKGMGRGNRKARERVLLLLQEAFPALEGLRKRRFARRRELMLESEMYILRRQYVTGYNTSTSCVYIC